MIQKSTFLIIILILGIVVAINAQEVKFMDTHATMKELNCAACHDCINPSHENPCLKFGPHFFIAEGKKLSSDQFPPELLTIDGIEELYGPVKFKHKNHMHMAERIEDCAECHHYIPPDLPKRKCQECHSANMIRDRLDMISLNGVYHRECLGCHVEWGESSNCELCHVSKRKDHSEKLAKLIPKYREVKRPDQKIFVNRMFTGPFVNFPHKFHADNKKIVCADCHVKEPCAACHYQNEKAATLNVLARPGVHGTCRLCHDVQSKGSCIKCHTVSDELYEMLAKKDSLQKK